MMDKFFLINIMSFNSEYEENTVTSGTTLKMRQIYGYNRIVSKIILQADIKITYSKITSDLKNIENEIKYNISKIVDENIIENNCKFYVYLKNVSVDIFDIDTKKIINDIENSYNMTLNLEFELI